MAEKKEVYGEYGHTIPEKMRVGPLDGYKRKSLIEQEKPKPKPQSDEQRYAKGGVVRGCGMAKRGKGFGGVR